MNKVRILTDNHIHQGRPVAKGQIIEVDDIDRDFLVSFKIGETVNEDASASGTEV